MVTVEIAVSPLGLVTVNVSTCTPGSGSPRAKRHCKWLQLRGLVRERGSGHHRRAEDEPR